MVQIISKLAMSVTLAMAAAATFGEPAHYTSKTLHEPGDNKVTLIGVAMSGKSIVGYVHPTPAVYTQIVAHGKRYREGNPFGAAGVTPLAVNKNGDSTGYSSEEDYLQLADGSSSQLPLVPHGISDDRTIAGCYSPDGINSVPAVFKDGVLTPLPTVPGALSTGCANAINQWDVMVGAVYNTSGILQGAKWHDNILSLLPLLSDSTANNPKSISSNGIIVGDCVFPDPFHFVTHGCMWRNGVVIDLGTIGYSSSAASVNAAGTVVGTSLDVNVEGNGVRYPTIYTDGHLYDATPYIDVPDGVTLTGLISINNAGEILALGTNSQLKVVTLLLTPTK